MLGVQQFVHSTYFTQFSYGFHGSTENRSSLSHSSGKKYDVTTTDVLLTHLTFLLAPSHDNNVLLNVGDNIYMCMQNHTIMY